MALSEPAQIRVRRTRRLQERNRIRARRARGFAVLTVFAVIALVASLVVLFSSADRDAAVATGPAPAERLLPAGPPEPEVMAMHEGLRILLPVNRSYVTAIGYHAAGRGTLALEPIGTRANAGFFDRITDRLFGDGGSASDLRYYLLDGDGPGSRTSGLDVGVPVGTDVYAPVDGTVIGVSEYIVSGRPFGVQIDIQPSGNPDLLVSLTNLRPDQALTVGTSVSAARSKIGRVIDLSAVETAALAAFTNDNGQHVRLTVHPAAIPDIPG